MKYISVIGAKNSGKTTLVEQLISIFVKSGLAVASIKHTAHRHHFDTPGKDSYRHRKSGARICLAISETEGALFFGSDFDITSVIETIASSHQLCIVEGDTTSEHPKLLLTRNMKKRNWGTVSNIIATYGPAIPPYKSKPHFSTNDSTSLVAFLSDSLDLTVEAPST